MGKSKVKYLEDAAIASKEISFLYYAGFMEGTVRKVTAHSIEPPYFFALCPISTMIKQFRISKIELLSDDTYHNCPDYEEYNSDFDAIVDDLYSCDWLKVQYDGKYLSLTDIETHNEILNVFMDHCEEVWIFKAGVSNEKIIKTSLNLEKEIIRVAWKRRKN